MLLIETTYAQNPFITTWKTDNPGTSDDNQVTMPTDGGGYNYTVDWGNGNSITSLPGSRTVDVSLLSPVFTWSR